MLNNCALVPTLIVLLSALAGPARTAEPTTSDKPRALGSRRELFVDRYLVERLADARLLLHPPRDEGKVLGMDKPWEGPHAGYSTVVKDGDRYLLYYRAMSKLTLDGSEHERTAVAHSRDGTHWVKPELGLFEFQESKANNIVLANAARSPRAGSGSQRAIAGVTLFHSLG